MNKKNGQAAVEALITTPVILGAVLLAAIQGLRFTADHLLWVDLVTLHRSRLYDAATECRPHSFWPETFRRDIDLSCASAKSEIRNHFPGLKPSKHSIHWRYKS